LDGYTDKQFRNAETKTPACAGVFAGNAKR
jgi:hypothetical protein